jgi:hypothetical protein
MAKALKSVLLVAFVGALLSGCSSDEDEEKMCKALCNFVNECGGEAEDCSDTDTCVDNVDDLTSECRSALKEFTDCWDKHPDCAASDCVDQADRFATVCGDEV